MHENKMLVKNRRNMYLFVTDSLTFLWSVYTKHGVYSMWTFLKKLNFSLYTLGVPVPFFGIQIWNLKQRKMGKRVKKKDTAAICSCSDIIWLPLMH